MKFFDQFRENEAKEPLRMGIFSASRPVDRNGVILKPGQSVRVQHCVGRYGETRTVEGQLLQVNKYHGVTIRLSPESKPFTQVSQLVGGQTSRQSYKPGDTYYIANCLEFDHEKKQMVGYHKHNDFEHGHEAWVEVLKTTKPGLR